MIGIIGALDVEVNLLKDALEDRRVETVSGIDFAVGRLYGREAVVAMCGVGKVFAALCAQTMILKYSPEFIVNVGVGGALSPRLDCFDCVVAESLVQHDMDTSALGDPVGMLSGINIVNIPADARLAELLKKAVEAKGMFCLKGVIASGDTFVASAEKKAYIRDTFDAALCEMEGAAIAQVCYVNRVPVAVLRSVSDKADGGASVDFPAFVKKAAENTAGIMELFCKSLP